MSHLALEKILKAHVTEATQAIPAKSHDLIYCSSKAELDLPLPYLDFIGIINSASIPTRYPEDLQRALHEYPEPIVSRLVFAAHTGDFTMAQATRSCQESSRALLPAT